MIENVPRIAHAPATVNEMARTRRAEIDRIWKPDIPKLRERKIRSLSQNFLTTEVNGPDVVLRGRRSAACQYRLADVFVMSVAGLNLLGDRMHVAEAALKLV